MKLPDEIKDPGTALVNRISDAVGGLCKPWQIKRVAKAEAEARLIEERTSITITDLHRRAMARFANEEAQKQQNMEDITERAIPLLKADSTPDEIERDWITNFFDKCRIVSDKDMQVLWSKILAGEANSPSAYSKRTVNMLASLDKDDAILFAKLLGFSWIIREDRIPIVFDREGQIYNDHGISFSKLNHLDSIGILSYNPIGGLALTRLSDNVEIDYFGSRLRLHFNKPHDNVMVIGEALLTNVGEQLAQICMATPVEGFIDYVIKELEKKGIVVSRL